MTRRAAPARHLPRAAAGRRRHRRRAPLLLLVPLLLAGCRARPAEIPAPERAAEVQAALARGVAHAEVREWEQALALFERAHRLAPEDPAAVFDLALAQLRLGRPEAAGEWLERLGDDLPAPVRARVEQLRGKLALERGDAPAEAAAYRRAAALDPAEPLYPYALSQVLPRLGGAETAAEIGEQLERAHRLWPANSRLAAELAQWYLERPDRERRRRGLELLEDLTAAAGRPEVEALVARGRSELLTDPASGPSVPLRRALNLLRPGKRFQKDSADLEAHLEVMPYAEPLAPALRSWPAPRAVAVALAPAPLLPELPLEPAEAVRQVVASNDATEPPAGARREADLTVLTDRALWFLGRADAGFRKLATAGAGPGQVVVGELDGDGRMEIVLLAADAVRLFARPGGGDWVEQPLDPVLAASRLRRALLLDFEHDGDLDLLAAGPDDRLLLVTHRGEAGWGPPGPAPLPVAAAAGPLLATDLDGDADQDLLLGDSGTVRVLVNWRQGEFQPGGELAVSGTPERLVSLDLDGDGRFDVAGLDGGRLLLWRNSPAGALAPIAVPAAPPGAGAGGLEGLAAGDLDLDGGLDLVAARSEKPGAAGALTLYPSSASGLGRAIPLAALEGGGLAGLAVLDLDGDRAPDVLLWNGQGLATLRSQGLAGRRWLVLALRGLAGKVPLDARGARVVVSWGIGNRARELDRPEVLLGLGERAPALVKVTWPNGISEYLHAPEPDSRQLVEQVLRIEGSCPFLYASDGRAPRFVTDILGLSPLGMLAAPGRYVTPDPEEYLRLPDWVAPADGVYELRITEELREVAYIDQSELVAVDAPAGIEVYNGERWVEPPVRGLDLRLLGPLEPPASVRDHGGREVLELVAAADHRYLTNHAGGRLYQGAAPPHTLTIELPVAVAAAERPALVLVGWLHWGNTSVNVARAQDPGGAPVFPYLEVPDGRGGWRRTAVAVGLPAGKTKPVVVDLAGVVDPLDPRVRLTTDFEVYWDRVAVAEALPAGSAPHREHRLAPQLAELRYGGFSRWYRPAPNGPYLFDYADRRPVPWRETPRGARPISWRELAGFYSPFGPVTDLVARADDRLVVFGSGEELLLRFDAARLPALPGGWRRTLFLHSEGWEKDGDPNVACAETVGPLPWRDMRAYPCPAGAAAGGPPENPGSSLTRWVDADRLERRVRAWASSGPSRP